MYKIDGWEGNMDHEGEQMTKQIEKMKGKPLRPDGLYVLSSLESKVNELIDLVNQQQQELEHLKEHKHHDQGKITTTPIMSHEVIEGW